MKEQKPRKATMKDVAIRADVALGTVSRIINGNETVAPDLRAHVLKVIDDLGYRPNTVARTMRTNRTEAVGIVVTDIRQPIAAEMIAAATDVLRAQGYAPIVGDFRNDTDSEALLWRFMAERNVDGLLLTISSDENPALLAALRALDVPVVLWERDADGAFPSVRSDHRLGTRLAGENLRAAGRRRVLLVAGHENTWTGREQIAGMREGLGEAAALSIVHTGRFRLEALGLGGLARPDAVVANIHDIPAVLRAIRAAGLTCPGDVAVISIGDSPFLEVCDPPVTAIRIRPDLVGRAAALALLRRMNPDSSGQSRIPGLIAPEFCSRASS